MSPLTAGERRTLAGAARLVPLLAFTALFCTGGGALAGWSLARGLDFLARKAFSTSLDPRISGALIAAAAAAGAAITVAVVLAEGPARAAARADQLEGLAEEIQVRDARLVEQEEADDEGPHLLFLIGGGRALALSGQWLYVDASYTGAEGKPVVPEADDDDEDERQVYGESFPSDAFLIRRAPRNGAVFRITPFGGLLSPSAVVPEGTVALDHESQIIDGDAVEMLERVAGEPGGGASGEPRHREPC